MCGDASYALTFVSPPVLMLAFTLTLTLTFTILLLLTLILTFTLLLYILCSPSPRPQAPAHTHTHPTLCLLGPSSLLPFSFLWPFPFCLSNSLKHS